MSGTDSLVVSLALLILKSSLILAVAMGFTRLLKRSSASARHAVWGAALLAVLAMPVVSLTPYELTVPVALSGRPAAVMSSLGITATLPTQAGGGATQPATGAAARPATETSPAARIPWGAALLTLYLLGAALGLTRLVAGSIRANRLRRGAVPTDEHHAWRDALEGIEVDGRTTLWVSKSIRTPLTYGFFRPIVLLPWNVGGWSAAQKRAALVHELAHVRRRDAWAHLMSQVANAVYWFHPGVHFAAQRMRLEAERACDELVVHAGADPGDYAQQLVTLTREQCRSRNLAAVIPMAKRSDLWHRVDTILNYGRIPMRHHRWLAFLAIAFTTAGLMTAPLELTFAHPHDFSDSWKPRGALSPLMKAARSGDAGEVRRLLDRGAAANEKRRGRGTPLIHAADAGHADVAELLIDAGAKVNGVEAAGRRGMLLRSPLASAARGGHLDVVELLLARGAQVDLAPQGDASALMEAAEQRHGRIVSLLLENGADVNRRIDGDGSPLIAAARGGDLSIVRQFVEAGAKVNAGVPGDGNALIWAVESGNRPLVDYLLSQGADPNAYVPGDETALVKAAENGDRAMMRLLLEASEDGQKRSN